MSSGALTCRDRSNPSSNLTSFPSSSSLPTFSSSSSSICYLKINDAEGSGLDLLLHSEKFWLLQCLPIYVLMVPKSVVPPLDSNVGASNSTQTMPNSHLLHERKSNTPLSELILSFTNIHTGSHTKTPFIFYAFKNMDYQNFMTLPLTRLANLVPPVHSFLYLKWNTS